MSVTVVYPSPGKFDNVKGTLTMVGNKVRMKADATSKDDYAEAPVGADGRFIYQYAAEPQKIVLGNGQDDPGLFLTALNNNLTDQRYLPFENAGAVSSWHFELPASTNEIDLTAVSDVVLHLYYTALESDTLKGFVEAYNADNQPTTGIKVFSARNDFAAPAATDAVQFPLSPWDNLFSPPAASDQTLVLTLSALKFPAWTRGRTITITGITAMTVSWIPGAFVVEPQVPLTAADVTLTQVAGTAAPSLFQGPLGVPANLQPGKAWTFKIRTAGAADFRSLKKSDIGDLLLLVAFQVT